MIRQSMGVTKQAAQKRFVAGESSLDRFTDRAKVVVLRRSSRRSRGHQGGHQSALVLGLLAEWDGYAGRAIEAARTHEGCRRRRGRGGAGAVGRTGQPTCAVLNQAEEVHELIVRESLRLGHTYVGTEHILLGLLEAEEEPGQGLTELGVLKAEVEAWTRRALDEHLCRRAAASC